MVNEFGKDDSSRSHPAMKDLLKTKVIQLKMFSWPYL